MDFLIDFFSNNFSGCVWLITILVSMCPTLESKIAIPLALNTSIWGSSALSPWLVLLLSFIGSILPYYIIVFIIRKIKSKTTGFFTNKFLQKYMLRSQNLQKQNSSFKKYLLLTAFVSVPLPLTGVWTGSLITGLSNLNIHYAFLSVAVGAFISSASITLLCTIFDNSIPFIFMISLFIIILFMAIELVLSLIKPKVKS